MSLYLSDFIYGGIDGIVTTFSIVAGSSGGELLRNVIIILGLSNVISDGFSMGVSRYISLKTELRQELAVNKDPLISGIVTFSSFIIVGMMPLLPFLINDSKSSKYYSLSISCVIFFIIGYLRGIVINEIKPIKSAFETLILGLLAAVISYLIAKVTNSLL